MPRRKKFPWPTFTDGLFNNTGDIRFNAILGDPWRANWNLYSDGYMVALDYLLESITRKRNPRYRDTLIYPILFLFHHHLELRFKNILSKGGFVVDLRGPVPQSHDLTALWPNTKKIIHELNSDADQSPLTNVDRVVRELMKISRSSEGYRYPVTVSGERTILGNDIINFKNLKKVILNTNSFFDAVTLQVEEAFQFKCEYEREMEAEMRASMEHY